MIPDMINNKKLNLVVTELFVRGTKLSILIVFIPQSYFKRNHIGKLFLCPSQKLGENTTNILS